MKMALLIVTLFSSMLVSAVETRTDCPMMRDQNGRSNPKVNLTQSKAKPAKSKASFQ